MLQRRIVFLGHVVTEDGVSTDPAKSEQISKWPRPKSFREVRGFLGLCGYYQKFIDRYAEIAAPLTSMLKKGHRFCWTDESEVAFQRLKTVLTSPPILAMPKDKGLYILDTDASDVSIGAVLSQVQDGQ